MKSRGPIHALFLGVLVALLCVGAYAALGEGRGTGVREIADARQLLSGLKSLARPASTGTARFLPDPSLGNALTPSRPASAPVPLPEELRRYVAGLDGTYGVAVRNLADGQTVLIDADRVVPTASLYKVLVMYRVYQLIERGELSSDSTITFESVDFLEAEPGAGLFPGGAITVGEAIEWMITFSSNPAAYALARTVGGWDEVISAASELGMKNTEFDGEYFVSTPADMLRFFELLGSRSLVSSNASKEMIAVLLRQQINDRLPAYLPPGTKVAHKTGELPGVRNDAGIVFTADGPYVVVIMSQEIDPSKAVQAEARISRMIFDRFGAQS